MAHAFRDWALTHRHEYGLLFASPLTATSYTNAGCTQEAGQRFAVVFAEIFATMWQAGVITAPELDKVDPRLLRGLEHGAKGDVDLPLPVRYLYMRQWIRLYGIVTLEAFGHLSWAMEDSVTLFEATLDDCAAELGVRDGFRATRTTARES